MAFCPFMSRGLEAGNIVACQKSCALNVDGHCAFNILARVSLQEAGARIYPVDSHSQEKG